MQLSQQCLKCYNKAMLIYLTEAVYMNIKRQILNWVLTAQFDSKFAKWIYLADGFMCALSNKSHIQCKISICTILDLRICKPIANSKTLEQYRNSLTIAHIQTSASPLPISSHAFWSSKRNPTWFCKYHDSLLFCN
jgi:hypothetical protein